MSCPNSRFYFNLHPHLLTFHFFGTSFVSWRLVCLHLWNPDLLITGIQGPGTFIMPSWVVAPLRDGGWMEAQGELPAWWSCSCFVDGWWMEAQRELPGWWSCSWLEAGKSQICRLGWQARDPEKSWRCSSSLKATCWQNSVLSCEGFQWIDQGPPTL